MKRVATFNEIDFKMLIATLCIAFAVHFEARGEPLEGQKMVAQTVMTRAEDSGKEPCEVVLKKAAYAKSIKKYVVLTKNGPKLTKKGEILAENLQKCVKKCVFLVAKRAKLAGKPPSRVEFFHELSIKPHWAAHMKPVKRVGGHIFYARKRPLVDPPGRSVRS